MKTVEIVNNFLSYAIPLYQSKILTKSQVYILIFLNFTAILSICYIYSVLTVKSYFCEHRHSNNGQVTDDLLPPILGWVNREKRALRGQQST